MSNINLKDNSLTAKSVNVSEILINNQDFRSYMLSTLYPVGSVYLSLVDTSPSSFIGGTWTKLPANFALWTATSGLSLTTDSTNEIAAGLPNITGQFSATRASGNDTASGAFSQSELIKSASGTGTFGRTFTFDANNGASTKGIYGNSSTVQPPAYKVYAWKRTA